MDNHALDPALQHCAVCKPGETYCKVKAADGYVYYMAEALLDTVLGRLGTEETPAYEVLEKFTGKDLEYRNTSRSGSVRKRRQRSRRKKATSSFATITLP